MRGESVKLNGCFRDVCISARSISFVFFKDVVLDWAGLEWDGVGWDRRVRTSDVDFNRLDNYCTDVDIEIEVW